MNSVIALNRKEVVLVSGGETKRLCIIPGKTINGEPGYGVRPCPGIEFTEICEKIVATAVIFFVVGVVFLGLCNPRCRAATDRAFEVDKKNR